MSNTKDILTKKNLVMYDSIDGEMIEVDSVEDARDYVRENYTEGSSMHPDFSSFDVYEKVGQVLFRKMGLEMQPA